MTEGERYDVVVVGGGPAGSVAARCLAERGRRVLLVDAGPTPGFKVGETLPPAVRPLMRDLGLWDRFVEQEPVPCHGNVSAWGSPLLQGTDFIFDPNGTGWHLDRPRFDWSLREAAAAAGAEIRQDTSVRDQWRSSGGSWEVRLETDRSNGRACTGWLLDATGRRASIARRAGARRRVHDALTATVAVFDAPGESATDPVPDEDRDTRTMVEAVQDGWWYSARIPGRRRVVAYLTDADLLPRPAARSPSAFLSLLMQTRHVRRPVSGHRYALAAPPTVVSARSTSLDSVTGDRWLAVGDAALALDPLSSQGIFTAIYSGMLAGRALDAHLSGEPEPLRSYGSRLAGIAAAYQRNHQAYYAMEQRWPDRAFWRRRSHPVASSRR